MPDTKSTDNSHIKEGLFNKAAAEENPGGVPSGVR